MTAPTPETSLAEFVRQCWPELGNAWHLDPICERLLAMAEGRIPKPNRKRRRPGIGGLRVTARIEDDS